MRQLIKPIALISASLILSLASSARSSSEGPNSPSSASGLVWKNISNIFASDNSRASYNSSFQDILSAASFGFSSVTGVITGITVEIEGYGAGASPPTGDQIDIALTKNGSSPAGSWKLLNALPNGVANEAYIARGGSTDLWGTAWTPIEIANSSFGVLIRDSDILASPLNVDHIRVTVYYTVPAAGRRLKMQKFIIGD